MLLDICHREIAVRRASLALTLCIAGLELGVGLTLGGCGGGHPAVIASADRPEGPAWQDIVTPDDQARLIMLEDIWTKARGAVPPRLRAKVAAEGPLLDPAAALELPALPPGFYQCRLVRLGGRQGFATYKPDFCFVDGNSRGVSLTKQTGTRLPGGWLHPDGKTRQIFLGTLRAAGAKLPPPYGENPAVDQAGVVERVAPFRWRLVLPTAGQEAMLDVYELVPVVRPLGVGGSAG